jgi:hypothetical protein
MKLKIPTELNEITLDQVQRALLVEENEDISPFAKKVHFVSIMTGVSVQEIGLVTLEDLDRIYNRINEMVNGANTEPLKRFVKYLGREYAFIEDVRDMETGAFVDADQLAEGNGYAKNLHKIMAILYRPMDAKLGDNYRLKSYVKESNKEREQRQAIFLQYMTLDVVRGATSFFLLATQKSLNISGGLFPVLDRTIVRRMMAGAGTDSFTPSAVESL